MILLENSADLISMIVLNSSHPSTSITSPIHSITRKKDKCTTRETLVTAASHTVHSMESNSAQRLKVNSKKSATYMDLNHSSWCHATFPSPSSACVIFWHMVFQTSLIIGLSWAPLFFYLCVFAQLLITCCWQGNYQQNQTYKYSVSMTQQYNINGFVGQWNELIWQLSFLWLGETLWKNVGILLCSTDLDSVGCFWLKIPTGLLWLQARSPPPNDTWVCLFSTYQLTSFK